jgi:hypothetical protein
MVTVGYFPRKYTGQNVKLAAHLQLMAMLRVREVILLPTAICTHGIRLEKDNFIFIL